jgi:hypothetical protein
MLTVWTRPTQTSGLISYEVIRLDCVSLLMNMLLRSVLLSIIDFF